MLSLLAASLLAAPQEPAPAPAPAAAERPAPRIHWQRTLADALAVQRVTGRPLLICVNQDGEVFCERFANETYRDPGFVESTRGWVCVIASADRHTERDYDGLGRRIECPRFPGCTCSEHINIEPLLFERWFDGNRTAPRHIGVGQDGKVLFDRFLDRSMQDAIDLIARHRGPAGDAPLPEDVGALLQRRDAAARSALERRYRDAGQGERRALLAGAASAGNEPFDLLRMALREDDPATFAAAARALAATATAAAWIDLSDALARTDDRALAAELTAALDRVARSDEDAARFAARRAAAMAAVAAAAEPPFAALLRAAPAPAETADRTALEERLDAAERAASGKPDAATLLELARANLDLAQLLAPEGGSIVPLLYEDAQRAGERSAAAAKTEAGRAQAEAVRAVALWQLGRAGESAATAAAAMGTVRELGARCDAGEWLTGLCRVAAQSAAAGVYASVQADPRADVTAGIAAAALPCFVLAQHPAGTAEDARGAAGLFAFAGARRLAGEVLAAAVHRFPWSRELHAEFRDRIAIDRGAEALREAYAGFVRAVEGADPGGLAAAEWFAGYASIVAAELHVQDGRGELAEAAYTECVRWFASSGERNPEFGDSANHLAVLALAGRALLRHLRGDAEGAVADLREAAALRPASMTESDGLGRRPEAILRRIARELREQGKGELADRLPAG